MKTAGRQVSPSTVKRLLHQHKLRGCWKKKKLLLQKQHLKAQLRFTADHMEKEKLFLLKDNSVVRWYKYWVVWPQWAEIWLEERRWCLYIPEHHTCCQAWCWLYYAVGLFCCQWIWCSKDSNWNNEGVFSPKYSRKPKIICHKIGSWVHWVFQKDNDCKHTSEVVKEWLHQAGIEVLELPSHVLMWTPSRTCGLCRRNRSVPGRQQCKLKRYVMI